MQANIHLFLPSPMRILGRVLFWGHKKTTTQGKAWALQLLQQADMMALGQPLFRV